MKSHVPHRKGLERRLQGAAAGCAAILVAKDEVSTAKLVAKLVNRHTAWQAEILQCRNNSRND